MNMDLKDKKQVGKNKSFIQSFGHAIDGLKTVMREERNMKFHVLFSIFVIIVCLVLKINKIEWIEIITVITFVLVTEIVNTSFENLVDLVTNHEYNEIAKKVKDMAAGAVLLTTFLAIIVGCLIILPKIWYLLT